MTDRNLLLAFAMALLFAACGRVDEDAAATGNNPAPTGGAPPPIVQQALADLVAICTEIGGRPQTADAILRADLNADGAPDYVLNGHALHCEGAASAWGDRARLVRVFAGDASGSASEAFSGLTWGARLEADGTQARLWLGLSGEDCGKPPAPDFASESFCDRHLVWDSASRKFAFAPLATVRMLQ